VKGSKSTKGAEDRELEKIRKELARARSKLTRLEAQYKKVATTGKTARSRKPQKSE
jgi:hypothetical protein